MNDKATIWFDLSVIILVDGGCKGEVVQNIFLYAVSQ